jgi:hypothetical protein
MSEQTKSETSAQSVSQPGVSSATIAPAQPEPTTTNRKLLITLIIGAAVVVIVLVLIIVFLYNHPGTTAWLRDMFIIALAVVSFVIGLLMLVLVFQLQSLIALLRNEIKPMLTNANQTVSTVRGTAVFVSDNLVKPTIGVASFFAGLRGMQQAFVGKFSSSSKRSGGAHSSGSKTTKQS